MEAIAACLARFQRSQPPAPLAAPAYRALLLRHIDDCERELCDPTWRLPRARELCRAQREVLERHAASFDARVDAGRVVEGHGDLRPEHVWLGEPLAILDALEFSGELRLLDVADEAAFLALECEKAHAAPLACALLQSWRAESGDEPPAGLIDFHQSCRACNRARQSIWHLHEARYRASPQWRRRALHYLALAACHLRAAQAAFAAARP
jgi:aminoglycoside phosphotransferase family enzyme